MTTLVVAITPSTPALKQSLAYATALQADIYGYAPDGTQWSFLPDAAALQTTSTHHV